MVRLSRRGSTLMANATDIACDLEERRQALMIKARHLEAQIPPLAYRVVVEESCIAKAELEALLDEIERTADEAAVLRYAFFEAVKRCTQRDAHAVMAELGLTEQPK